MQGRSNARDERFSVLNLKRNSHALKLRFQHCVSISVYLVAKCYTT